MRVDLGRMDGCDQVIDLLDDARPVHDIDGSTMEIRVAGYGFHWFRLQDSERATPP